MRVAILSDIHGNLFGLEAVLADIAPKNVDAYWFLGDYCFGGSQPKKVLETITALPNTVFIYGNAEQYMINPIRPQVDDLTSVKDKDFLRHIFNSRCDLSWVIGAVAHDGWLEWMKDLPLEYRTTLPDGTSVLLVHASPGEFEGDSMEPSHTDDDVWEQFGKADEDLIFVGHRHFVQERFIQGKHIINVGCIGKPIGKEVRASYAILSTDTNGYDVTIHYVPYDTEAFIQELHDLHFPTPAFMTQFYRGEYVPPWERTEPEMK